MDSCWGALKSCDLGFEPGMGTACLLNLWGAASLKWHPSRVSLGAPLHGSDSLFPLRSTPSPAGYFSAAADLTAGHTHISLSICWWLLRNPVRINFPNVLQFLAPGLWRVNLNILKSLFLLNEFYVK